MLTGSTPCALYSRACRRPPKSRGSRWMAVPEAQAGDMPRVPDPFLHETKCKFGTNPLREVIHRTWPVDGALCPSAFSARYGEELDHVPRACSICVACANITPGGSCHGGHRGAGAVRRGRPSGVWD